MSPDLDPFAEDDAAYVMGALSDERRREFEAHLDDCPACATSVAELSGMTGWLDKVPLERVLAPQSQPELLPELSLPRLLRAARTERRRRAAWQVAAGAVAASVVALAVVLGVRLSGPTEPTGATVAMQAAEGAPVSGTLVVTPVHWGTKITLDCRWVDEEKATASESRKTYRLVAVPRDGGAPRVLAQWAVWPGEDATVVGSTDLRPDQIANFRVTTAPAPGEVLLRTEALPGSFA